MNRCASLLLALLAGCEAPGGTGSGVSGIQTVAVVHLANLQPYEAIPLAMDGRVLEVVMDTGAVETTVTAAAARGALLPKMDLPLVRNGVGGATVGQYVLAHDLSLAGADIPTAFIDMLPTLRFRDRRLCGLAGSDLLANWDLDIDIARGTVTLDRPQRSPVVPPWAHATTTVPLADRPWPVPVIPIELDGHAMLATFDTGAPRTMVDGGTPAAAEAQPGDPRLAVGGIAGVASLARLHHFGDLVIGGLHLGPIDAAVAPRAGSIPVTGMILGLDTLRLTRFYVAFQAHQLLIDEGAP